MQAGSGRGGASVPSALMSGPTRPDARTPPPVLQGLRRQGWLPVLRGADVDDAVATALACGVDIAELAFTTPAVLDGVRRLVDAGLTVGVGTVRTADQVRDAAAAGASFVASFYEPDGFVATASSVGVPALPGGFTAHELAVALDHRAPAVQLFPAGRLPPDYLGDLRAVLGDVPIIVTGGLGAAPRDLRTWLDAGAWCVGVGSHVGTVASDGAAEVRRRAGAFSAAAWTSS